MTRLARAYLAAESARQRAVLAMDAVWTGCWLGLLGRARLHAVDAACYARSALYASDAHNGRGLFPWEERALAASFPGGGRLLLVGAGGGREALALAERGYVVDGYECLPSLVDVATRLIVERGASATVRLLDRDRPPPAGPPCDAAIVGWSAYMLVAGRDRRVALLRGMHERLVDGAPILLSFFTRPDVDRRLRLVRAVASGVRRLRGDEPPELGDDLVPNYVHRFTRDEVFDELAAAGFAPSSFEPPDGGRFASGSAVGRRVGPPPA